MNELKLHNDNYYKDHVGNFLGTGGSYNPYYRDYVFLVYSLNNFESVKKKLIVCLFCIDYVGSLMESDRHNIYKRC